MVHSHQREILGSGKRWCGEEGRVLKRRVKSWQRNRFSYKDGGDLS